MNKGETSILEIQPKYGYGAKGDPEKKIPPNATLMYKITLTDFVKGKESWEMNPMEKLAHAQQRKLDGNHYFKIGAYARAVRKYREALSTFEHEPSYQGDDKKRSEQLKLDIHSNSATCHWLLKDYTSTLEESNKALGVEPNHVKSLFRRGQIMSINNETDRANEDMKKVSELNPQYPELHKYWGMVKAKIAKHIETEKKNVCWNFWKGIIK